VPQLIHVVLQTEDLDRDHFANAMGQVVLVSPSAKALKVMTCARLADPSYQVQHPCFPLGPFVKHRAAKH
jgi:hypothetical protein